MACLLSLASLTGFAAAQESEVDSITMSPVSQYYHINAGESKSNTLTVINDGKKAYDFIVYARPYSVNNEKYEPNFTKTPTNADVYGWVQFPETKYHLEPGKSTKVKYTMAVPAEAAPGGHYGVIFVETQPATAATTNSVIRKKRVGSIIYATVNGQYKNAGEALSAEIPFWQVQPPLHTSVSVKNTGNADFITETRMAVKDVLGNVKYETTKQHPVLPQTTRKITIDWVGASWFGLYKVDLAQKVLGKTTTTSGYVLMMPRYLPIALLVVILIGGIYAWYRHKKQ
jgi:hypothetical protein